MLQLTLNLFSWSTPPVSLIIFSDPAGEDPMLSNKKRPVERISRESGKSCSRGPMWAACPAAAAVVGVTMDATGGAGDDDDVA